MKYTTPLVTCTPASQKSSWSVCVCVCVCVCFVAVTSLSGRQGLSIVRRAKLQLGNTINSFIAHVLNTYFKSVKMHQCVKQ